MANVFDFFDPTRLHQVPRFEGDGLSVVWKREEPGFAVLGELAERIKAQLS